MTKQKQAQKKVKAQPEPVAKPRVKPEPEAIKPVETPEPMPEPEPEPEPETPLAAGQVRLQLVSESGQYVLRTLDIPAEDRRPTLFEGLEQFVAAHVLPNGTWVYRRVGVERA